MIVAVTGSSGFIGRKLVQSLLISNHEVKKLDLEEGVDILDWDTISNIEKFDVLVHLAAMSFVPASYSKPREFYHTNIAGLINVLELSRIHNAKIVFASSYVYGIPESLPINETHPIKGFNPYAETKIIGEKIIKDYYKYFDVKSIILRPFNIYGPGQNESFLIPEIIDQAKTGEIRLKDPRPKRDYIYIDDVVNAFMRAIENNSIDFDCFNIGSGKSFSVKEVVEIVNQLYNGKLKVVYSQTKRKNEVLNTIADIEKASRKLNWSPMITLEEGLESMIK